MARDGMGMFIKKVPSGRWYWMFSYTDEHGENKKGATGIEASEAAIRTKLKGGAPQPPLEVLKARADKQAEVEKRRSLTPVIGLADPNELISVACDREIARLSTLVTMPSTTRKTYQGRLRALRAKIGNRKLRELSSREAWVAYRSQRINTDGCATSTVQIELLQLEQLLRYAGLSETLRSQFSVLAGRKDRSLWLPKPQKSERSIVQTDSFDKLVEIVFNSDVAQRGDSIQVVGWAMILAISLGTRSKEIRTAKLRAIHLKPSDCWASCKLQDTEFVPHLCVGRATTKTSAGVRELPIVHPLTMLAMEWLMARAKRLGATEGQHHLFPRYALRGGNGHDPAHPQTSWKNAWAKILKLAGIEGACFHDLRHSWRRALRQADPSAKLGMELGGWSGGDMAHWYDSAEVSETARAMHKVAEAMMTPAVRKLLAKHNGVIVAPASSLRDRLMFRTIVDVQQAEGSVRLTLDSGECVRIGGSDGQE